MAQTKRKRRSKHRGTAAGTIERRGRTSRRVPVDPKAQKRADARARRSNRLDRPPTWKSATLRGLMAAGVFFVLVIALFRQNIGSSIFLAGFMTLFYIPLGYYTDLFIYRRRQKRREAGKP